MTLEFQTLADIVARLETAGTEYMLTGSMALNCYAQPRMTRGIDLVVAFYLKDVALIQDVLGAEYYVAGEAAREAVIYETSFNAIHTTTMIKVDFMIRNREEFRLLEFSRRRRMQVGGFEAWVVSRKT